MTKTWISLFWWLVLVASASAQQLFHDRPATITSIDSEHRFVGFSLDPKYRSTTAKAENCILYIPTEVDLVRRLLPDRRKVTATFADLQVGQRVIVSGNTSVSSQFATEVIILPDKKR